MTATCIDVLTIGRSGVDIYPLQTGVGLEEVTSFGKFLGGSPTNVAVAAARLGHSSATITGVGDDPFGRFVRNEMRRLGVSDEYVVENKGFRTPVTFCEIFPPDNFPLYFYREPSPPDLRLNLSNIPKEAVTTAQVFLLSGTGLSREPSRSAHRYALEMRNKRGWTIADLDYRSMFWRSEGEASEAIGSILDNVNVAVGNLEECRIAVGESEADRAADALLERGIELAIVKQGLRGTIAKTADERVEVPVTPVKTVNGLGAGDAFGGALAHALIMGWDIPQMIAFASTAGAIVGSRLECSTAMPHENEIFELIAANPQIVPIVKARS